MIFAVVGPSGAGKDTLIAGALRARPGLRLARRVITRPTEAGGEDFEGVTPQEFAIRKARGEFVLDWDAHGLSYGLPRAQVDGAGDVIFNGSRAALRAARAVFPDLRVIVITAPPDVLVERLAGRGRETTGDIARRLDRAGFDLPDGISAATVMNDSTPDEGVVRLLAALDAAAAQRTTQDHP